MRNNYCCLVNDQGNEIPLKEQTVFVAVYNQTAVFTVKQKYVNEEQKPIEAMFTFPTPAEAAVIDFEAETEDGRLVKCHIKEKEEAKEEYNKAKSEGNGAFYMDEQGGDVFRVAIGNLAAGTKVELRIKYVVELKNKLDSRFLKLIFPLTIMPRFSPVDSQVHRGVNPSKISSKPFNMSIGGNIVMSDGILSLNCETHKLKVSNMFGGTSISFDIANLGELLDDIVLVIERNAPKSVAFTQEMPTSDPMLRFCTTLNIVPDFSKLPPVNINDVYYAILLDKSGSMGQNQFGRSSDPNAPKSDMDLCKTAAQNFVSVLPTGCQFDVYAFDSDYSKFTDNSTDMLQRKNKANEWISKIQADGGTNLRPVLEEIYNSLKQKKSAVILVLSDGGISDTDEVFRLVKANPNVAVFSIGIGSSVSQDLIRGLSTHGNGHAEFINSGSTDIITTVLGQLQKSQDTLRKYQENYDIQVECKGKYQVVGNRMPTLYDRMNNVVHVFSDAPLTSVTYTEKLNNVLAVQSLKIEQLNDPDFPMHRIAGVKFLNHLNNLEETVGTSSQIPDLKTNVHKKEIVSVSTNLNVLSKHTAFVGVEYKVDKVKGPCVVREVPLQMREREYEYMNECAFSLSSAPMLKSMNFSAPSRKAKSMGPSMNIFSSIRSFVTGSNKTLEKKSMGSSDEEDDAMDEEVKPTPPPKPVVKLSLTTPLGGAYTKLFGGFLVSTGNSPFPLTNLVVGDYIELTCESDKSCNGIYKVVSLGSVNAPWTLQLCN
jgi:von Willebrand factor A domain-containing protein 5